MTRRLKRGLGLLPLVLLTACTVTRYDPAAPARLTVPLTPAEQARYDYAWIGSVTLTPKWSDGTVAVSDGHLRVMFPQRPDQDRCDVLEVKFEYWRALEAAPRAPAVLITPILGGGRRLARTHCGDFARSGMHVILAWRGTRVMRRSWRVDHVERFMQQAIGARRALLDWAQTRPEIDPDRLGAFGVSMGGILTSAMLGAEPRLKAGVVALAGGDIPNIVRHSVEGRLVRFRETKSRELKVDLDGVERLMKTYFHSDPLALAPAVDPRKVLFISTRFDDVVPPKNQLLLWEALGKPLRYDLPAGHYSAIAYLPYVTRLVVGFLERRLKP